MTTAKTVTSLTPAAVSLLARLIREANPTDSLPADDLECVEACDHNNDGTGRYELAESAVTDSSCLVQLRHSMGLPVLA